MTHLIQLIRCLLVCTILMLANGLKSQTKFHFVQTTNVLFYESSNWFCDFPAVTPCVPPWLSGTTNFTIPTTDTVVIHGACVLIDITTLTNQGVIEVVDGSIDMSEVSFLHNDGEMYVDENSNCNNGEGGTYNLNNGSNFYLNGMLNISNFGNLNIQSGSNLIVGTTGSVNYY